MAAREAKRSASRGREPNNGPMSLWETVGRGSKEEGDSKSIDRRIKGIEGSKRLGVQRVLRNLRGIQGIERSKELWV